MATSGSHRAQPFGGRGRRERRRTKRDPWGALQGAAARATPRVAGGPPMSGTHRPQGRLLRLDPQGRVHGASLQLLVRPLHQLAHETPAPAEELLVIEVLEPYGQGMLLAVAAVLVLPQRVAVLPDVLARGVV